MHPLKKLFTQASAYRRDFQLGTLYSILNKFFDILPEVLIGVAVVFRVGRREKPNVCFAKQNWGDVSR